MRKRIHLYVALLFALLLSRSVFLCAQTYPIRATLQVTPPYSGYLLDYTDETNEKLKVLLTLNDINISNYDVKLVFSIEGNGYSIRTKPTYVANPISLQGGVPVLLGAYELNTYFSTNNLQFTGLSSSIYEQNKSLPEGYYTISVTAYDYSSAEPKQVSNTSSVSAWFTLSDPPQPISPTCGEQINVATSPQLVFQWLNQSVSPYGQNNTEYVLELFEVRPDTKNPNDAVQSSYPVFSTTVEQAIFIYGPAEIPLIEGMLYVWRVKAQDKNGRLAYKNKGYSTVCTFRYGSKYAALESQVQLTLQANVQTHRMVMASWDSIAQFTDYILQYKKANSSASWREVKLSNARKKITDLEPNTTYQAKVKGQVEDYTSPESNTVTFTTLPAPSFTCNSANSPLNPAELNVPPLQQAAQDMIFTVGLFEMQVTQITGSNGVFSGKGIMFKGVFKLPVLVQFSNISVNQNQVVTAGEVYGITSARSQMLVDVDVLWGNIQELLNELNTQIANGNIAQAGTIADSIVSIYPDTTIRAELATLAASANTCASECDGSGSIIKQFGGRGTSTPLEFPSTDCIANCYADFQNAAQGGVNGNSICDENKVPINLKALAQRAIICDNDVDTEIEPYDVNTLGTLCIKQRLDLINCVSQFPCSGNDDRSVMRLIQSTQKPYRKELLTGFKQNNLLKQVIDGVDGSEFVETLNTINNWIPEISVRDASDIIKNKKVFIYNPNDAYNWGLTSNNCFVYFQKRTQFLPLYDEAVVFDPWQPVLVTFASDVQIGTRIHKAGEPQYLSGIYLYLLFNNDFNKDYSLIANNVLNIPLFFLGVGEIKAAKDLVGLVKAVKLLKGSANVAIAGGSLALAYGAEDELIKTEEGKEILAYWSYFNLAYATVQLSPVAINSLKTVYQKVTTLLQSSGTNAPTRAALSQLKLDVEALAQQKGVALEVVGNVGRFIAKSGTELKTHLNSIVNKPVGKTYNGDVYRSLSISSETAYGALPNQFTDHHIFSSWGRYDIDGAENAMYLSKTLSGNQMELIPHYGEWSAFSTYKFSNVQVDNLLDLTDDVVRQQLGTEFKHLTKVLDDKSIMYEYTNVIASWARQNGYNGIVAPGARGVKNYENVILFNQSYVDQILQGKTAQKIIK